MKKFLREWRAARSGGGIKNFHLVTGVCFAGLAIAATASTPDKRFEDIYRAQQVNDIVVSFPDVGFDTDSSTKGRANAALHSPELTIRTSSLQTIVDTLYAVSSGARVECSKSDPVVWGLVRIEFNDKHVDDYYLTSSQLIDRRNGQCFPQSAWISRAFSFWNAPDRP
ncbi:MAG TPA: hypothetical protein VGH80_10160 [Xanthomonadaceae bacterium]|jgi:hypothetical protein